MSQGANSETGQHRIVLAVLLSSFLVLQGAATIHSSVGSSYNAEAKISPNASITLGYPFKLAINQTAYYEKEDVQLRFVNVTEDSRCPTDVQCISAGQVSILVELARASDSHILGELALTKGGGGGNNHSLSSKSIDGYLVELADVEPYPVSTKKIEQSDYLATLIVLKADDAGLEAIIPSSPVALDAKGHNKVEKLELGEEAIVSMALHNNFHEDKPFVAILEVRSLDDGITQFLAFPNGIVAGNSWVDVGLSWTPKQPGSYQLRTFLIDTLDTPQILSPVQISEISVEESINGGVPRNATSVIEGNNQFSLDFYSTVAANHSADNKGNVFFSPWSMSTAFALVNEGSRGKTAEEIQSVFGFPSDENARRTSFEATLKDLNDNEQGNYTLDTANAIWVREGYKLSDDFGNTARQYYSSEVNNVIFTTEEGRSQINDWVESKTHNKIKDLIPEGVLDDLTRLIITNAVYFKGTWVTQFDEKDTAEEDFKASEDKTIKVQMMKLDKAYFKYAQTDQLQILELPYQGDKVSILMLLPRDGSNLKSLEESLAVDNLTMWKNSLRNQSVIVNIPKFTLKTSYTLNEMLSDMGMPSAFNPEVADLSGLLQEPEQLYIQAALHKGFVEVNEEGTEAAAATGVVIGTTSVHEYPVFRADHPFVFLIQDSDTGNILFMGRVVDPS